ncbi:MAG: hypothetical protein H6Q25_864 [Bacteroidetes bacterium]|nr:hypothetical protein [Bacteroidota bacterium]
MFAIILFTILSFINPSGKCKDFWIWNSKVIKTELVTQNSTNQNLYKLSVKKFLKLSTPHINYFFNLQFCPLIEKLIHDRSALLFLKQNYNFIQYRKQFLFFQIINVIYPPEVK